MTDDLHLWVVLLLVGCIFMLAAINIHLVMQQIRTPPSEERHASARSSQLEQITAQLHAVQTTLLALQAQPPESLEPDVDTSSLFKLDNEMSDSLAQLERADGATEALLLDLQQTKTDELNAWRDLNAERIADLVEQQKQLRGRIASLQNLLSDANATILTLRSRTRRNTNQDAATDATLVSELQDARKNTTRLNGELNAANANVQALNERIATREMMLAEAGEQHEKERAALDTQIAELQAKIQSMQSRFDQTVVEKIFIEDAFLEIEERDRQG